MKNLKRPVVKTVLLAIPVVAFAYPMVYLVQISLTGRGPGNYWYALTKVHLELNMMNSAIVSILTVLSIFVVTMPAAFAFSKMRFRLKSTLYLSILLALMIPGISIAVPVTKIIRELRLFNNYLSLVLVYTSLGGPFFLVLARSYYDQLPYQILEASIIDGCSYFQSFIKVHLPITKPLLASVGVLAFLQSWNEFLFAMLFMKKSTLQMVTTIPIVFKADFVTNIPGLFAALVIIQMPVLVLYLAFQKAFREGLTAGAIK